MGLAARCLTDRIRLRPARPGAAPRADVNGSGALLSSFRPNRPMSQAKRSVAARMFPSGRDLTLTSMTARCDRLGPAKPWHGCDSTRLGSAAPLVGWTEATRAFCTC